MKTLYLLRHAQAENLSTDKERGLTAKGINDAKTCGLWMRGQSFVPEKIISSSALRTLKTAENLGFDIEIEHSDTLYNTSRAQYLDVISGVNNTINSCLIVAHNPTIMELAYMFCGHDSSVEILSYRPCTFTALSFDTDNWLELTSSKSSFKGLWTPA